MPDTDPDDVARAKEAMYLLGFAPLGGSDYRMFMGPGLTKRFMVVSRSDSTMNFEFGMVRDNFLDSTSADRLICYSCDDGSSGRKWCNHLGLVVTQGFDAVPLYANPPMQIHVPLVPSLSVWHQVRMEFRAPLDAGPPAAMGDDPGYPYEVHMSRTGPFKVCRDYLGMYNKFDSIKHLRRMMFDWGKHESWDAGAFRMCKGCSVSITTDTTTTDQTLIALKGLCIECTRRSVSMKERQEAAERAAQVAMARFQRDDLIPDVTPYSAKR